MQIQLEEHDRQRVVAVYALSLLVVYHLSWRQEVYSLVRVVFELASSLSQSSS